MRSNLTFNFVTDLMNSALARIHLGEDIRKITPMGLRGAIEIKCFLDQLNYTGNDKEKLQNHETVVAALPIVAKELHQNVSTFKILLYQIAADPLTQFLEDVWTANGGTSKL